MKKLLSTLFFCCLLVLTTFLLLGPLEAWMELTLDSERSKITYSVVSFCFLASDILLPVPNSLIMLLNGKVVGVFWGTLLSLFSGLLSSLLGFYLGRKANPWLGRMFSGHEEEASSALFQRYGKTAIALSKALPVLSEAVSFVSGTTSTSLKDFLVYSVAGHLVVSLVYAYAGSQFQALDPGLLAIMVMGCALVLSWLLQRTLKKKRLLTT
ncbi:TVP38/TMEM64 family protein [Rufibacter psychrotolerans]|uniref:TVP38/TMEM64 family protein n=1 Tax=Rufibacter psychrotolerans TaxID=2812556 RepID=UPI0019683C77|nr:VTT domain-containing protein [Rufibacter sp. SYSU D00308]